MREGWTYKKIGDICDIKTGKLDANAASLNGVYPFFTCSKETLCIDRYSYDCECVLIAGNGDLNVKYYHGKFDAYQRTYIVTIKPQYKSISTYYLYKFFCKYIERLRQLSIGGVIKYIKLGNLTDACIPVPPIAAQERIVAELDLLSGIIEKKKEQLKTYDQLAQSIFYTMFGDPIDNPKGWETKKLDELCTVITKGTTPTTLGFPFVEEGINFVKVESFIDGRIDSSKLSHITHECNLALSRSKLEDKDLLVCIAGATIGKMAVVDSSILPANTNQACAIIRLKDKRTIRYIQSFLELKFENDVMQMGKGVAQPNLSLGQLRNLFLPMPPIGQRETFTTTLEAIERQKALVQQSIDETQTMFDYTMDKYFG